jgi:hypothetical protein
MITSIADAVTAWLNAGTYSRAFTAARTHNPRVKLEELTALRVSVTPRSQEIVNLSRDSGMWNIVIDIGVQEPVEGDAGVDATLQIVEEIIDRMRAAQLPEFPSALYAALANDPVIHFPDLDEKGVATSVVTLTYRVKR